MVTHTRTDPADVLDRVGRHWGWLLGFGIITVLVGILVLVWPGRTLIVVAVLFGIQLIVMGIFRFASAFGSHLSAGTRVLYALRHVLITLLALALLLGIFWIISGAVELFNALSNREMRGRGWAIASGILGILAGIIVLVYPGISLFVLALVLSIWLLVFGIMEIVSAFRIRSLRA